MYNILGIGHPRTGTRFTSKLMRLWGLDVGHENFRKDGMIAWQMVAETGPYPYLLPFCQHHNGELRKTKIQQRPKYKHLIYNVRNPYYSIPSIVYTEDTSKKSFDFRQSVLKFSSSANPIDNTILSLLAYEEKANELRPNFIFKIEDGQDSLYKFLLDNNLDVEYVEYNKKENTRTHKNFSEMISDYGLPSTELQELMNNFCIKYGYERVFNQ